VPRQNGRPQPGRLAMPVRSRSRAPQPRCRALPLACADTANPSSTSIEALATHSCVTRVPHPPARKCATLILVGCKSCSVLADEVFTWLSGQPAWQRDLARRLTTRVELDGDEILDALAMIKSVYGVATSRAASPPRPLQREDLGAGAATGATWLLGLGGLEGVGRPTAFGQPWTTTLHRSNSGAARTCVS
jgi:predicted Fe-S protein YdhL (DUF1289 family)